MDQTATGSDHEDDPGARLTAAASRPDDAHSTAASDDLEHPGGRLSTAASVADDGGERLSSAMSRPARVSTAASRADNGGRRLSSSVSFADESGERLASALSRPARVSTAASHGDNGGARLSSAANDLDDAGNDLEDPGARSSAASSRPEEASPRLSVAGSLLNFARARLSTAGSRDDNRAASVSTTAANVGEDNRSTRMSTAASVGGRRLLFVSLAGMLLFVTSIVQLLLASKLQFLGIEVLEVVSMESYYRAAGNPVAGFLAYGIGASFVMISYFAEHGPRVRFATHAIMIWSIFSLVIIVFSTFDQLAVYNFLKEFTECTAHTGVGPYEGDCLCLSSKTGWRTYQVDIARHEDFRCEDIPGTTGGALASYILTWIVAIVLGWLIGYFDDEDAAKWEGWAYASAVVLSGALYSLFYHHFFFEGTVAGMQIRAATTTILYDKVLRLSLGSLGQTTTGHLMNLASADIERFQLGGQFVNHLWKAPLETLVILYFGMKIVGVSFLAGSVALAFMVPMQVMFSRQFASARQRVTVLTDERVKLTNQAVFTTLALLNITQFTMGKYLYQGVQASSESWVSIKRLEAILLMEETKTLTAQQNEDAPAAMPSDKLDGPKVRRGTTVAKTLDLSVATPPTPVRLVTSRSGTMTTTPPQGLLWQQPGLVWLKGASFRWETEGEQQEQINAGGGGALVGPTSSYPDKHDLDLKPKQDEEPQDTIAGGLTLDSIDLRIEPGQLVGVVGPVGSSKSSLLMALLREMTQESWVGAAATALNGEDFVKRRAGGEVSVQGSLAYASQEPWIQSGTLRENILFGRPLDRKRYDAIIRDCALLRDLALLPSGDQTVIGNRGVNLSGGQKARVGLARVAYAHADIYLMDDPLSAVDPAVGRELFSKVVCGRLKRSTRVLVTHQVHYLRDSAVNQVIIMDAGRIVARGSFQELEASGYFRGLEEGITSAAADNRDHDDMSTVVDTGYASYGRFIRPPHHRNRGSCISSVTFMGEPFHEAETETETEPESEAETGVCHAINADGIGITSTTVSRALGAPAPDPDPAPAPAAPTTARSSSVLAMLENSSQPLRGGARDPAGLQARQSEHGRGADLAAVEAAARAESWVEAWAEEEDEWIGRLAAADRTQSSSSLRLSSDASLSSGGHAPLSRTGSMTHSRPGSMSNSRPGGMSHSRGGSLSRALGGSFSHSRGGSLLHLRTGSLTHSRGGSLSHTLGVSLSQTLGGSLPHSRAGSLSHSRGGSLSLSHSHGESLSVEAGHGNPFAGGKLPVAPELVSKEDKQSGVLKRSTYAEYAKEATGVWQVLLIFLSMTIGQVLMMAVTVWLARWSRQSVEEQSRGRYVGILFLLTASSLAVSLLRSALAFSNLVKASHRLHDRMLSRVIRAPILFFDSNPVGRILNRFTKDMHFMDDLLPMTMYDFTVCCFMVIGGTLIVFFANPWVILSMIPALGYFMHLLRFSMKTSREVKRLEAVTRSPVYSLLSETLDGLVTIRAFSVQHRFLGQFMERVDLNTRAYFAWVYVTRWLGFRLDMVVAMVLTASCFFSVAVNEYSDSIDAGLLGAALVYVLQLGGLFQWSVRQAAEVENQMVSAERVLGYCKVSQEANLESEPAGKPKDNWPTKGGIEIRNMSMRYRHDLPPVLKDLTLSLKGGSRVGVVGRTGAGKSSLIAALFRLVEYDTGRGSIEIDGVDISTVGLHDLRPRMSVVPQTPFLFSGSMRLNLDPFARQSDVDMWAALEAVQMEDYVLSLPGGLDAPVSEGGGNLSVGQRQLLCLARAVLQRSQILVMDEATANIDQHTDSLIQDVVRTSFKGKTVIMVAHRLNTVIDCDQVVVLSEGGVVEAGHPHLLLQAPAGTAAATLSSMVEETGQASEEHLRGLAREAWEASALERGCQEQAGAEQEG
eukprot:g6038.t1